MKLKRNVPKSLHDAPALLPTENTSLRRALETWFREQSIRPRIVAEFEDLALMKVMAAEGRGFIALPSVAVNDPVGHCGFQAIGRAENCRVQFHAITAERRMVHPAVEILTTKARSDLFVWSAQRRAGSTLHRYMARPSWPRASPDAVCIWIRGDLPD